MPAFDPSSFVVGLTGGIGSGKTVCSDHFQTIGVPVIDTDVLARQIVEPGQAALSALIAEFGEQILNSDQTLNRAELREVAFSSDENKAKLDAITHPAIRALSIQKIAEVTYPYCIVVIPLLSKKSAFSEFLDRILVVTADYEIKIERVKKRSQLSRAEVEQIMQTQLSEDQRKEFADDIIANDRSIKDAQLAVEELHQNYLGYALS